MSDTEVHNNDNNMLSEDTLCVKVVFDQYMRRTSISKRLSTDNSEAAWPSYDELVARLREAFSSDVPETFHTKYMDDENDWIFFSTTNEFHEAIHLATKVWETSVPKKKAPVLRIKLEGRRNSFFFRNNSSSRVQTPQKPSVVESFSPRPVCNNEKEMSMFMEIIETIKTRFADLMKFKENQIAARKRKASLATLVMDSRATSEKPVHPDSEVIYESEGDSSDDESGRTKKDRLQIVLEDDSTSSSAACAIIKLEGSQASTSNSSDYVVVDGNTYSNDTHSAPSLANVMNSSSNNNNNNYDNNNNNNNTTFEEEEDDGRWEIEVQILNEMGFDKSRAEAMELLHKYDGNIQLVVKDFLNL